MARAPFTYPFCYTPDPDIVAATRRLIDFLDSLNQPNGSGEPENFALRAHPPQPDGWVPPVHEATGGHGFPAPTAASLDAKSGTLPKIALSEAKSASADRPAPRLCASKVGKGFMAAGGSGDMPPYKGLLAEGKMLGVLKVEDEEGEEGYLYAFSGTVGGRATLPGFVPPIFDLTDPEGYFRKREAEISAMAPGEARKAASAELQAWIFDQYRVSNALGETISIREVFARRGLVPPGGTGDCAAPKLLQYAYSHGLTPLAMGEFWYGASPASEVREQGRFYPSCTGKCGPLLSYMLEGLDVAPNPLDREFTTDTEPRILHEDADILVVNKPAGMLAVPGRTRAVSLLDWLRARYGEVHSCHRLDMDTSGVMVFARNLPAKVELERQFAEREVAKTYRARLVAGDKPFGHAPRGTIALPLALDYYDRPRQMVDREHGKLAITEYEVLAQLPDGEIDVRFTPKTGRTHQLRVHAAHAAGLGRPIKGDRLYGSPDGGRLWLHAESLTIHHPASGAQMRFESVTE